MAGGGEVRREAMTNTTEKLKNRLALIAEDAGDNRARSGKYLSSEIYGVAQTLHGQTVISYQDGKAVQEILRRYIGELKELDPGVISDDDDRTAYSDQLAKDINYIEGLARLFD
jgi:hypothetical protein